MKSYLTGIRKLGLIAWFIAFSLLSSNCVTKQKTVTKKDTDSSLSEREAFIGELNYEKKTTTFDVKDFANIFSNLKWNYQGGVDDAFSVEIQQTEKGYKAEVKGSGTAEASVDYQSEIESLKSQFTELYQEFEEYKRSLDKKESSSEVEIEKTKEEKVPWGLYFYLIIALGVVLYVVYILYKRRF